MPFYFVLYHDEPSDNYVFVKGDEPPPNRLAFEADDGKNANGLAAIKTGLDGRYISFDLSGTDAPIVTNTETQLTADSAVLTNNEI